MMRNATLAILVLARAGCGTTSGRIGEMPQVTATNASTVVTVRVSSIVGAANGYTVAVDGKDLYGIGSGEYATFQVPAGERYIAVKCFGGWSPTWKEDSLKFTAIASTTSYFLIEPTGRCASIKAITEVEAEPQLKGSKAVNLETKVSK